MSTPPNRSTLSNYAAPSNTTNNKAQAGAVAVAGAIGSTIARGAASWINEATKTIQTHIPAARSATQYYSYDAKRTSEKAYKSAKKTLRGVAGGAVRASNWMGLDLSLPEDYLTNPDDEENLVAPASKINNNNSSFGSSSGNNSKGNNKNSSAAAVTEETAIELGEGNLVPGEEECHYTPQPTGFAGSVEVTRVQIQMSPALVVLNQGNNNNNNSSNNFNVPPSNLLASSSCAENMNSGSQSAAVLSLCLLGPGGSPGFAIFRVDCNDVFEEVVELHLSELDSLGPVKSVCVAEVLSYPSSSSSSYNNNKSNSSTNNNDSTTTNNNNNVNVLNPLPVATKIAIVLTERCILQYNISQRKVIAFQQLAFEASDLKLCSYYALVVHSGFGQISVLSLNSAKKSSSSSSSSSSSVSFSLDELDVIVPEGDETALSDRWLAYVGSGSEAARVSTRLLSHAEKTTAENISKHVHAGLKAVGGFLGSAMSKALQVTGVSSSGAGAGSGSGGDATTREQQEFLLRLQQQQAADRANNDPTGSGKDDFIFNPSSIGALADRSDKPVGTVVIRDLAQRSDIAAFVAHENPIKTMAFDSTGTILATCAVDGKNIHVFRICPKGTATATATVSSAAAFQRLPRLPSFGNSMYALGNKSTGATGGKSTTSGSGDNAATDSNNDLNEDSTNTYKTPNTSSPTTSLPRNNNNNNQDVTPNSTTTQQSNSNNPNYPNTTIVFSHRINRGLSSGSVESLTFSQPWTWLACTTTIGTAHFFKLEMDRLTNVEENIVACENGMLAAANVNGASFRIRSAPSTVLPSPVVSFFPGEASTGAGEQTTACLITKSSTVATAVVSSVNDKGVLLYERAAAHFAGPKSHISGVGGNSSSGGHSGSGNNNANSYQPRSLMNRNQNAAGNSNNATNAADSSGKTSPRNNNTSSSPTTANPNSLSGGGNRQDHHHASSGGGGGGGAAGASSSSTSGRFMTAEACWMELLHRRTQPQFQPLYDGVTVELLPEDEDDTTANEDDEDQ